MVAKKNFIAHIQSLTDKELEKLLTEISKERIVEEATARLGNNRMSYGSFAGAYKNDQPKLREIRRNIARIRTEQNRRLYDKINKLGTM